MQIELHSTEQLLDKVALLEQEVAKLKATQLTFDAQNQMLENLLYMVTTPEIEDVLKITLGQAVDIFSRLTAAESTGLVWFDQDGDATHRIFKHLDLTPLQQQNCIELASSPSYINRISHQSQVSLVADTSQDPYWQAQIEQPSVVRSLMSIPIFRNQGLLGVLTLMHSQPNFFTPETAYLVPMLVKNLVLTLEFARFYGQIETYNHALQTEINKGREMQQDFLPNLMAELPGWDVKTFFQPARQVAGDFYDIFLFPHGSVGLVIGDVCDKGVGAALFMGLFRSLIRIFSGQHPLEDWKLLPRSLASHLAEPELSPHDRDLAALEGMILTNNYIAQNHHQLCMFATIFFAVLNPSTGTLVYVNGGHESPVVLRQDGTRERLSPTGPMVGSGLNPQFNVQQVQLHPGDILLGYTDGVTDARSPQGRFFTQKRLLSLLNEPFPTLDSLLEQIQAQLQLHVEDASPFDDITLLAIKRLPS